MQVFKFIQIRGQYQQNIYEKKKTSAAEILTVKQLASYLQMDEHTIYRLAKSGKIPAMKIGPEWRFKKALIDKWIEDKCLENINRKED